MNAHTQDLLQATRRQFLVGASAGAAGLLIGFRMDGGGVAAADDVSALAPNAFLRLDRDGGVTVIAKHFETGQGAATGLATLIAEELDADWAQVKVEWAPADAATYNNLFWGPIQGTGGSTAIANSFMQYRKAGAVARHLLMEAAAQRWGVDPADCTTESGKVRHGASGREIAYGELVGAARTLTPPAEVALKAPQDFRLIGRHVPRIDSPAKTDGSAVFALDVRLPDMVRAVIARPPRFGATLGRFDATQAKALRDVIDVVPVATGVAVIAETTWAAIQGREALDITWDESGAEPRGSAELFAEYRALADQEGAPARRDGDAEAALAAADTVLEGEFTFPYLAHAPMEPLNCTIKVENGAADIWAGSQLPTVEQQTAAAILELPPEKVRIHTVYAGGSFGRRATPNADYIAEAAMVAKAFGGVRPIQLVWTREDDVRSGFYRPLYLHKIRAGLDDEGRVVAWQQRIVGQSILDGTPFEAFLVKDGIDQTSVEGAANLAYQVPNLAVDLHTTKTQVPVLWWRSVGHTHTAFSTETFVDELAHNAGRDPVEFRLSMLDQHPRHVGVLRLAAEKAGWGDPLPEGWGRGVAVHESFSSYVAQVVEVSRDDDGAIKLERIVCAVDCGLAVNPDVVRAQMEGGIGYGLGAAMRNAINLEEGEPMEWNFPDYEPLRMADMPAIEVHMVASEEAPTGVGEPGVPPVAPALANAIFAATGQRIRDLPFAAHGVTFAG